MLGLFWKSGNAGQELELRHQACEIEAWIGLGF